MCVIVKLFVKIRVPRSVWGNHFIPHIHHFQSLYMDRSSLFVCHIPAGTPVHSPCFEEQKLFVTETWCGKKNCGGLEHQFSRSNFIWSICSSTNRHTGPTYLSTWLLLKQHWSDIDWGCYRLSRSIYICFAICAYTYVYVKKYMWQIHTM